MVSSHSDFALVTTRPRPHPWAAWADADPPAPTPPVPASPARCRPSRRNASVRPPRTAPAGSSIVCTASIASRAERLATPASCVLSASVRELISRGSYRQPWPARAARYFVGPSRPARPSARRTADGQLGTLRLPRRAFPSTTEDRAMAATAPPAYTDSGGTLA